MKILVVEDDAVSRLVLERALQRWGHEPVLAMNGEDAWARFLAEPYQMVITDWMMPKFDGLELCRRIRSLDGLDYTYIILLTAKNRKEDLVEGMNAGADDFIAKPFDAAELEVRIRAGERILRLERSIKERTKQLQAVNEKLRQSVRRENLLNRIARLLSESLELETILNAAVTHLREVFKASRAFVMLLSSDGRALQVVSEHCSPDFVSLGSRSFPLEPGVEGASIRDSILRLASDLAGELKDQSTSMAAVLAREYGVRSLLSAPIIHANNWLGEIGLHQCDAPRCWSGEEISLIYAFARQLAFAITNAQLYRQVQELAVRDGLTGLFNRRCFDETLLREVERARRFGRPLSLVMIDLDNLKTINDQLGHLAGDEAIRQVGEALAKRTRQVDIAARYGGEEFAVILLETATEGAQIAAESWRAEINQRTVAGNYPLSASIGVATYPVHARTAKDLIQAADLALYRAKREGRNCVRVAEKASEVSNIVLHPFDKCGQE